MPLSFFLSGIPSSPSVHRSVPSHHYVLLTVQWGSRESERRRGGEGRRGEERRGREWMRECVRKTIWRSTCGKFNLTSLRETYLQFYFIVMCAYMCISFTRIHLEFIRETNGGGKLLEKCVSMNALAMRNDIQRWIVAGNVRTSAKKMPLGITYFNIWNLRRIHTDSHPLTHTLTYYVSHIFWASNGTRE